MGLVDFSNSGILVPSTLEYNAPINSGTAFIIQPETQQAVSKVNFSAQSISGMPYTITGMHTSLDTYIIAPSFYGYNGEVTLCSGISPTIELQRETFQKSSPGVSDSPATELYYENFESLTLTGVTVTYTGTAPSTSGIQFSTAMAGSAYLGYMATSVSAQAFSPTATSGINCGRIIFLGRPGTSSSSSNQLAGVSFLRNGPAISASGYNLSIETSSVNSSTLQLVLYTGQTLNSSGDFNSSSTALYSLPLEFSSNSVRNSNRNMWIGIEWEAFSTYVVFKVYHKPYSAGSTAYSVKNDMILLGEVIYTGYASGANLYTNTVDPVMYVLNSDNSVTIGIDEVLVEQLTSLPRTLGINRYSMVGASTGATRPWLTNQLNDTGDPPEGTLVTNSTPLAYTESSFPITNKPGYGYMGARLFQIGGLTTDRTFIALKPREDSSGIKCGVVRYACEMAAQNFGVNPKVGISFLRQGSAMTDNCYMLEFVYNASNDFRIRIRKGAGMTNTGNSGDFGGSVLATSANMNYSANTPFWIELRWKATGSLVNIEIFARSVTRNISWGYDTSPGLVDYSLGSSVLSYTDASSPYVNTTEPILLFFYTGGGIGTPPGIGKIEIRKAKLGN